MPITPAQRLAADQQQWAAARNGSPHVRVIAGPGTGKSFTVEKRVAHLLSTGAPAQNIYVISFTRATCDELRHRIEAFCVGQPYAPAALQVRVSTMHSLALRILRLGNLLVQYPSDPLILDDWEQENIYDQELSASLGCAPGRASEVRLAHDASWQTLNPGLINQAQITPAEVAGFNAFHAVRTNLYSCVLPGEVIYKCVEAISLGALHLDQLPPIEHLVVDEFQDLNACDQRFVQLLSSAGATLLVAGDDDQSIYSFRHANPDGIVHFQTVYPQSSTHNLSDCFRCTPAVLVPAQALIAHNLGRLPKGLVSLYAASAPPVQGRLHVWSFPTAQAEAQAIAQSCRELLNAGMAGRENELVILLANRRVQLEGIVQELANLGLPFDPPRGAALTEDDAIRAVFSILRIANDLGTAEPDYPAYRTLLGLLQGVGLTTARAIADACVTNNYNFRDLFLLPAPPVWLTGRARAAVDRIIAVRATVSTWTMADNLAARAADVGSVLTAHVFNGGGQAAQQNVATWLALAGALPSAMTLDELLQFFFARTESDQDSVLKAVSARVGGQVPGANQPQKRIRVLTMHGAKGLSGSIVFIPAVEQGIIPSFRSLAAAGLVIEQRRLLYVSLTRAKAACFISHASLHQGPPAFVLTQQPVARLTRSQFLNEMAVASQNRAGGLTAAEAASVVGDVTNL